MKKIEIWYSKKINRRTKK